MHTPDLNNKISALHASPTVSGKKKKNTPQRKKEIKRYGEREKLYIAAN